MVEKSKTGISPRFVNVTFLHFPWSFSVSLGQNPVTQWFSKKIRRWRNHSRDFGCLLQFFICSHQTHKALVSSSSYISHSQTSYLFLQRSSPRNQRIFIALLSSPSAAPLSRTGFSSPWQSVFDLHRLGSHGLKHPVVDSNSDFCTFRICITLYCIFLQ